MLILGLNAYHADAAAAIYRDGKLVAAVAEERLNRIKHCAGFPALAVREVLRIAGATLGDVDEVAIARDSTANLKQRLGYVLRNITGVARAAQKRLQDRAGLKGLDVQLVEACGATKKQLRAKIKRVEHHLSHAASSFFHSPFERAAILTLDGFGDFASTLNATGEGNAISPMSRVFYPHSLGMLYTTICQFIGFDRYGDEGKVMGLAPLGEPRFVGEFKRLLRLTPEGFELDLACFTHHTEGVVMGADEYGSPSYGHFFSPALEKLFGAPRKRGDEITQRDKDIAASLQLRLEQAFVHLATLLQHKTQLTDLCLAGGVALNGVANGKLLEQTPFKRIYIHPAAGDDGTAVGSAAYLSHAKHKEARHQVQHAYWGSAFDDAEIKREIDKLNADEVEVRALDESTLMKETAKDIFAGKVVGWFQGAMEWGPRALGNRSIVAHPGHPQMKQILNARIKHREPFRPFAPSILAEKLSDYFESDHESPFMLMVYRTRPAKYAELCAVDHVDHTGRVQTVTSTQNRKYHALIKEFGRLSGTPVVLNTSFNENEPIVCTPGEALNCFLRNGMDTVALGNHLVRRRGNITSVS
ncbi:MAG: carbamoyltransferase [Planctomycetes bacterium]|nr:carbamoyltransferase [Planctomycetota bacterium]